MTSREADFSEYQLQGTLKLAKVLCARDATEVRSERGPARDIEVGVIKEIVCLGSKLQLGGFSYLNVLLIEKSNSCNPGPRTAFRGAFPKVI